MADNNFKRAQGNTTSLGNKNASSGFGGKFQPRSNAPKISARQTKDILTNVASQSIAEQNYDMLKLTDKKVGRLREYIIKMAESWSLMDKLNTISQFGDASLLPVAPKGNHPEKSAKYVGAVNEVFARTIITRFPPRNLDSLMKDIIIEEKEIVKNVEEVEKIRQKLVAKIRRENKKTSFSTKSFQDVARLTQDSKTAKELVRSRKAYDRTSYRVPKYITNQYQSLRTELILVIPQVYNKLELAAIAEKIGITLEGGIKPKDLIVQIANKVILYVDLINGKSRKIKISGSIGDTSIYNELLQYTSFAFITGKPGVTEEEVLTLQRDAKKAKAMAKESLRIRKNITSGFHSKNKYGANRFGKTTMKANRAVKRNKELTGDLAKLEYADTGVLADKSIDEILEIAAKYGVTVSKGRSSRRISEIKRDIYRIIALNAEEGKKLKKRIDTAQKRGKAGSEKDRTRLAALKSLTGAPELAEKGKDIPYVNFTKAGDLASKDILKAVPVFVVNQWLENKKAARKELEALDKGIDENKDISNKGIRQKYKIGFFKGLFGGTKKKRAEITAAREGLTSKKESIIAGLKSVADPTSIPKISLAKDDSAVEDILSAVPVFVVNFPSNIVEEEKGPSRLQRAGHSLKKFGSKVISKAKDVGSNIGQGAKSLWGKTKDVGSNIGQGAKSLWGKTKEIGSSIKDTAKNLWGKTKDARNSIGQGARSLWDKTKQLTSAAGTSVKNLFNKNTEGSKKSKQWTKKPIKTVLSTDSMAKARAAKGTKLGRKHTAGKKAKDEAKRLSTPIFKLVRLTDGSFNMVDALASNPFLINIGRKNELFTVKGKKAIRVFDESAIAIAAAQNSGKGETSAEVAFSDEAKDLGITLLKKEPAIPVYIVNNNVPTNVVSGLVDIFASVFAKVPVIGAPISAALKLINASADGSTSATEMIEAAGIPLAAKGMHATGLSHFISGDSLTSKPNPEQVSVDWSKKSISVKPIPQFATGGTQLSTGNVKQLSTEERNKPMSVGIASHIITYSRALKGVKDENDKQALKVFSVNPGITDEIEIGSSKVSMIGLMADMATRLASIEGLLSIGNQQRSQVIQTSAATLAGVSKMASKASVSPFTGNGFTNELNSILQGN